MTAAPQRETPARWQAAGAGTSRDQRTRELNTRTVLVSAADCKALEETHADRHR